MIIKVINELTKFTPLILLFSLLSFSFSLLLSQIYSSYKSDEQISGMNDYQFATGTLSIDTKVTPSAKNIITILTKDDAPLYLINSMHTDEINKKYPPIILTNFSSKLVDFKLSSGRFFSKKEIKNSTPVALVSKTFWDNNGRTNKLMIKNKKYSIVGVIEDYRNSNMLTSPIYLNPGAFLAGNVDTYFPEVLISQKEPLVYKKLVADLSNQDYTFKTLHDETFSENETNILEFISSFFPVFLIAVISLMIAFSNYLKNITIQIGIKKMLGWRNLTIIWQEIFPLIIAVLTSTCLGLLMHVLVAKVTYNIPEVYLMPTMLTFSYVFFASSVVLTFTSVRIIKISPITLIRGNLL